MNGEYVGFERETTRSTTISFDSRDIIYILKRMKLKFHEFHEGASQIARVGKTHILQAKVLKLRYPGSGHGTGSVILFSNLHRCLCVYS